MEAGGVLCYYLGGGGGGGGGIVRAIAPSITIGTYFITGGSGGLGATAVSATPRFGGSAGGSFVALVDLVGL